MNPKRQALIKCDEPKCGWSKTIALNRVPKWYKRACPKCGKGEIVNTSDLVVYRMATALESVTGEIDPDGNLPRRLVHFDTAILRTP